MNFTCNLNTLLLAVNNVSLAISSKSNIPVLEGIYLNLQDNLLTLCGYDTDVAIKTSIPVMGTESGDIVINAKLIKDMLREFKDETVAIKTDEKNMVNLSAGKLKYSIMGFNGGDYPETPVVDRKNKFVIDGNMLKDMINSTIFSVAVNEATPVFTGELFKFEDNILEIAAVDGNRLSLSRQKTKGNENFEFIVPGRSLNEIIKLIGESTDMIEIRFDGKHAVFDIGEYEIVTRLLSGKFFDYKETISREGSTFLKCDVESLLNTINAMGVIINDKNKNPVKAEIKEDEIYFSCETSLGKAEDNLNIEVTGEKLTIGFNLRYMIEALKACPSKEIRISFAGSISPIIIEPPEDDSFTYLVLPVRLK